MIELFPEDGQPLPSGVAVFKLARRSSDFPDKGIIEPNMFVLTSTENAGTRKASVFAKKLTSPEQALGLMANPNGYDLILNLSVDRVRGLSLEDVDREWLLDILWHTMMQMRDGVLFVDDREGMSGHAGITGLEEQTGLSKIQRFRLRWMLAEIAVATWISPPTVPQ